MSERAIPTKRHFDSLQCLTNALHKKSFYLGSPGSSAPDESTCLGICAWPRWLYLPLFLPPLETGSRLSVETGNLAFSDETRKPPYLNCPYLWVRTVILKSRTLPFSALITHKQLGGLLVLGRIRREPQGPGKAEELGVLTF